MAWWRTLMNWRDAPGFSDPTPQREPRWAAPLTFSVEAPPEVTGLTPDGSLEQRVSRAQAMSVPAVKRARDLIAGTLGTLPVQVHNPAREVVANRLVEQPEPDIARSVTMTRTVEDLLFEGRSWWRITGFGWDGYPVEVRRLEPRSVQVRQDSRVYVSTDTGLPQGQAMVWVPDSDLIRIDSPNDPLLVAGARAIRAALLLDKAAARYANEPLPLGYFAPREGNADPGDAEYVQEMLDEWERARAERAWGYVGAALEAKPLQWSPEQLALPQARDHAVLEIARLCGIDPEDLGVSTTSRTYANAEQRRLDLLDFTLAAYVSAIESRLSMRDVLPRGYHVRFQYAGFLRSDTKTRMETYEIGRRVGVYNDQRIAELEHIPSARPQGPPRVQQPVQRQEDPVQQSTVPSARFADEGADEHLTFDDTAVSATFRVNPEKRTISGLAVPWGKSARSGMHQWSFSKGSLRWADEGRVKMFVNHDYEQAVGRAVRLENTPNGLDVSFKIARGVEGDRVLALAEDGVFDGLSIGVDFSGEDWDTTDDGVRMVRSANLREVSITAMPAYDSARVAAVAASQKGSTMTAPAEQTAPAAPAEPASATPDLAEFTAGLSDAIGTAVSEAFARLPEPQGRQVVPAGRAVVTREAPVYAMNGHGPSMVRDAWRARTENDTEARERLSKFQRQTQDAAETALVSAQFGADTTSGAAVIPPGYRPDLYVTQLMQGRPLVSSVSRGTLTDATPFTLPSFTSASGMSADHVEGTNPTDGTMNIGTVTVTPGAVSGLFELTREIVDSSNPAIDAIAMQAMNESYSQQTEQKVYAELNGTNGQGGTITGGFTPSGAQARLVNGGDGNGSSGTATNEHLVAAIRDQLALYPFRRFAAPNRAHLSQEATSALAAATGSDGRPLLPSIGAQNASGLGNAVQQGWFIDGLPFEPSWSLTGNAIGDADVFVFNSNDAWFWESSLLTFRFEERGGPARIDLALFGYVATRLLRPVGLSAIRFDKAAVL